MDVKEIASRCWEMNRRWCELNGDFTQPAWEDAPEILRNSVLSGVREQLKHPDRTPEESHEAWMAYKRAEGWTYGPEKNLEELTHPCMQAYDKLPAEQRAKDVLFQMVVKACSTSTS